MSETHYTCPTCLQTAPKPPWMVAREAGFDPARHCTMMANRMGRVVPCVRERLTVAICEECPINRRFTRTNGKGQVIWAGEEQA